MKTIKLMAGVLVMVLLTACGGTSYNPELCKELSEKIENDQTLTESDYNDMIDQMEAIVKHLDKLDKDAKNDPELEKKMTDDKELMDEATYVFGFAIYLEMNKDKLSADNIKKMEELEKEFKNLKK